MFISPHHNNYTVRGLSKTPKKWAPSGKTRLLTASVPSSVYYGIDEAAKKLGFRSRSELVTVILSNWLFEKGYLPKGEDNG